MSEKISAFVKKYPKIFVALAYSAASFFACFPYLKDFSHFILPGDSFFSAWTIGWNLHILGANPAEFWNANIFFPTKNTLAFSDGLFAQTAMAAPVFALTKNLVFTNNILILTSYFLAAWCAYLLAFYYTRKHIPSFIAGLIFGFAAYRIVSPGHFQNLHIFWVPLAILFLQKYLDAGKRKHLIYFSLTFSGQTLSAWYSGYFLALFVIFFLAYNFSAVWKILKRDYASFLLAGLTILIFVAPFAWPYVKLNMEKSGASYSFDAAVDGSADFGGYLIPPPFTPIGQWLAAHGITKTQWGENMHFVGFTSLLAILLYFFFKYRRRIDPATDVKTKFWLWGAGIFTVLSFGPNLWWNDKITQIPLPYFAIWKFLPITHFMRTPSRMNILVLLSLAIAAALVFSRIRIKNKFLAGFAVIFVSVFILFESHDIFLAKALVKKGECPPIFGEIRNNPDVKALAVLPIPDEAGKTSEYMLDSACFGYKPLFNGFSGYAPAKYSENAKLIATFPSEQSLAKMKKLKITHVLMYLDKLTNREDMLDKIKANAKIEILSEDRDFLLVRVE